MKWRGSAALLGASALLIALACTDQNERSTVPTPAQPVVAEQPAVAAVTVPIAPAPARPAPGDVLWRLDPAAAAVRALALPTGTSWVADGPGGATALRVEVATAQAEGMHTLHIPLDLSAWRGMVVSLTCQAKAAEVGKPPVQWNGVKCMLHWRSAASGDAWINEGGVYGTFEWRQLTASASLSDDATDGELILGLQDSPGTVWLAQVALTALAVKPLRPTPLAAAPPAYRGHDLPRLRGVMSPNRFNEQDFADLQSWNVNAVRWQMGRNWGTTGGDRDLVEYDRWLDGKLDELATALDSAQRHGIRLLVDLHAPPGGRLADGTMAMVLEKPYQEHFIALWQRIATRFKGHPALWAYDLINEPVQNRPSPPGLADWLGIQVAAAKAIRAIDPTTAISIEVDAWDNPQRFAWLTPIDVPNIIYQAHMYWPGEFTHQGVHNAWGEQGSAARLVYPGTFQGRPFDREALRRYLQPVRDFQRAYNVHVVIGEFSAVRWAGGADRYLADCTALFEEYGWDWTYHAFREWGGWSVEAADLPYDRTNHPAAPAPTARRQALQAWFDHNQH